MNRVKYKQNCFPSVHIGELYLQETATNNSYDANDEEEFLSVIMCVYNGAKYLEQAVNSILCQTYTKFEFIIVNDGSTLPKPNLNIPQNLSIDNLLPLPLPQLLQSLLQLVRPHLL